ncbi:hypothetical protein FRC08_018509 [Ceratobasidium sp. 394]|nr:hypothetical protein FRC08_018509 [Ceratobasidium sp. 394]
MPPRQAPQPPHNDPPRGREGPPDAQNQGRNAPEDQHGPPPEGATEEEMRAYITRLQLEKNNMKRQLDEVTRERDHLQTNQGNKRRRARYVDEPTPDDPKYDRAGKRCTLMYQPWIAPDLFETEPNPTYSDDRRYEEGEPGMQVQGNLQDVLASAPTLRENLLHKVHFQSVFINGANEQRRNSAVRTRKTSGSLIFGCKQEELKEEAARTNNPEFQRLLGYQADRPHGRRYRELPPMLYGNEVPRSNEQLFRHKILFRLFRACAFGPSTISETGTSTDPRGQHVLSNILGLKAITPGAIAFSAILARWCLSPDTEFSEKGLRIEQGRLARNAIQGPFTRLMNEWNKDFFPHRPDANRGEGNEADSEPEDIQDAMAQIRRFGQGGE